LSEFETVDHVLARGSSDMLWTIKKRYAIDQRVLQTCCGRFRGLAKHICMKQRSDLVSAPCSSEVVTPEIPSMAYARGFIDFDDSIIDIPS
jgi:hypothetical protein